MLALVWALVVWGGHFKEQSLAVLGDNTGALSNALQLKGSGPLLAVARELAWRQAKHGWQFEVGHVPSEDNFVADALSRRTEKGEPHFPRAALRAATQVDAPKASEFWKLR